MLTSSRSTLAPSRRSFALLALVSALAAAACTPTIIGGGSAGGGGDGTGAGPGIGGSAGAGGAVAVNAIAEYAYMIPNNPPPPGSSSSSGGTGVDPSTLYVKIGNYGVACGSTFTSGCGPDTVWEASIGIPPDMQAAPAAYSLSDPALIATFMESGGGPGGDCWGGGGSIGEGTLEILSNDGATIVVRISGTNAAVIGATLDGDYTASICQYGLD